MLGRIALTVCVALACALGAGCSAVISPDPGRLGGGTDAGPGGGGRDTGGNLGIDVGPGGCGAGQITCGGVCVQPSIDPQHCGGCTNACGTGQSCISGVCTGGSGSVLGSSNDCGPTHASCGSLEVCVSGACVCRPPYTDVGGRCIDLNTDPNHCGGVGVTCQGNCAGGTCVRGDCPSGTTSCDGACVDLRRDPGNCGECGRSCSGGEICVGQCRRVTIPTDCTSCPCASCDGALCCAYPRIGAPVCLDANACP